MELRVEVSTSQSRRAPSLPEHIPDLLTPANHSERSGLIRSFAAENPPRLVTGGWPAIVPEDRLAVARAAGQGDRG